MDLINEKKRTQSNEHFIIAGRVCEPGVQIQTAKTGVIMVGKELLFV